MTAEAVLTGQSVMAPTAATQTIQVASGQTAAATVSYATQGPFTIRLEEMPWAGLNQPIFLASPPGDATRIFVQERPGRIRVVQNGVVLATPFLDISARVSTQGERGMLSFAFHPQYAQNGWVFVHFNNLAGDIVVERFTVSAANANLANPQSAAGVIRIPHPTFDNHNGGVAQFGPDGMLFISTGDGGGGGDPQQNAQDVRRLLGKMLRLDVSVLPYRIPPVEPVRGPAGSARRSGRAACATRGAGRSTARRTASTWPTWAKAGWRRSTSWRAMRRTSTTAGRSPRAPSATRTIRATSPG